MRGPPQPAALPSQALLALKSLALLAEGRVQSSGAARLFSQTQRGSALPAVVSVLVFQERPAQGLGV